MQHTQLYKKLLIAWRFVIIKIIKIWLVTYMMGRIIYFGFKKIIVHS
jgi:hypothetical protein